MAFQVNQAISFYHFPAFSACIVKIFSRRRKASPHPKRFGFLFYKADFREEKMSFSSKNYTFLSAFENNVLFFHFNKRIGSIFGLSAFQLLLEISKKPSLPSSRFILLNVLPRLGSRTLFPVFPPLFPSLFFEYSKHNRLLLRTF
ncbi:hypothetical protein COP00_14360 [Bacillus glycinifermentans]|uniref:Uncharacterized protein n=1 Tax=Bacillus glycinifermentans TaxID=1664069 RepID=A0A0T6BJX4_9BACI|nr:hypothetical protein COP00_14360 [Bacillus glycinifermentans]KRT90163.1 hypothetical protein AB447_206165 [Bacillus glycinifermentans]